MSRHSHRTNQHQIYAVIDVFKSRCLLNDGSMFSDESLWTAEGFTALVTYFVDNPDDSKSGFFEKLQKQLKTANDGTKKLAAELFWLMQLGPSNVGIKSKLEGIAQIWGWSGASLTSDHPCLTDELLDGIGSGGMGYNTNRWRELRYAILLFQAFKQLAAAERKHLLEDPWRFATWLESVPDDKARQFRLIFLNLLFPDQFERIFSRGDRRDLLAEFRGVTKAQFKKLSNTEIDRQILEVREALANELGTKEFDFYEGGLKERWKNKQTAINPGVLDQYKQKFLSQFPADKAFTSDAYLQAERNYKIEIAELFSRINLDADPETVADELLNLFTQHLSSGSPQNLVNWRQFDGLHNMNDRQKQAFSSAVINLISGKEPLQTRADFFMTFIGTLFQELGRKQFPSKVRGITSFYLFTADPVNQPFIKTTEIRNAMKELTGEDLSDDPDQFDQVSSFMSRIKSALESDGWHPRDMIDLQSFIWVGQAYTDEKTESTLGKIIIVINEKKLNAGETAARNQWQVLQACDNKSVADFFEQAKTATEESPDLFQQGDWWSRELSSCLKKEYIELSDALAIREPTVSNNSVSADIQLNRILYGPPGTGKTFATINKAVAILDNDFLNTNSTNRVALKRRFDELKAEGRIEFVTFHQSFAYEDFVEGLRANTAGESSISYDVEDGVFKALCERCRSIYSSSLDDALARFSEDISEEPRILKTRRGKEFRIQYTGGKTFSFKPLASETDYADYSVSIPRIRDLYHGRPIAEIYNASYAVAVLNELKENYGLPDEAIVDDTTEVPHVLIIDEINRGNIANIFGELITLIEPSKRAGAPEALEVTLPYSKQRFSIPQNLYIIGTMNTADRSLVHVDTALRRRFLFEEMMPDLSLLTGLRIEDIDVTSMVEAINQRIELLYDREHTLGHSFFLPLQDAPTIESLARIMETEVFPLLEEYFFEDWNRIRQVLGDNLKNEQNTQFFIHKYSESDISRLLGPEESGSVSTQYIRNSAALVNPKAYIGIYAPQN